VPVLRICVQIYGKIKNMTMDIRIIIKGFSLKLFVLLKESGVDLMTIPEEELGRIVGTFAYERYKLGLTEQNNKRKEE